MRTVKRSILFHSRFVTAPALLAQGPPASRVDSVKSDGPQKTTGKAPRPTH